MMQQVFTRHELGMMRVAVVAPELRVADITFNTDRIIDALQQLSAEGCQCAVFPELAVTSYSCGDLFYQTVLIARAAEALLKIAAATADNGIAAIVGAPIAVDGRLYNTAVFLANGAILGVVPKSYLPNTNEFYEDRWFTPAHANAPQQIIVAGQVVPFGTDLLFRAKNAAHVTLGIEICEDLWAVTPPSFRQATAGATILINPSASTEILGKSDYRRELVKQQAARCLAAYLYAGASANESTTDVVYAGHSLIAENGVILSETERFRFETQWAIADLDLERLQTERLKNSSFSAQTSEAPYRFIPFMLAGRDTPISVATLHRPPLAATPFVPTDLTQRARHCQEIFSLQATGLAKRLRHTKVTQVVIGLSGGLDSTLALLVIIRAFDTLKLARSGIVAITMPGFGTTSRTRGNAEKLAEQVGITLRTISIEAAVRQHFHDIGHDEADHSVIYENAQARERTQVLMDVANKIGGLVIGTGDLSELALGWATFNGDHMSMYHVNAGVPKTLVRYLVEWSADNEFSGATSTILHDICDTPITPELLPLSADQTLVQETEQVIGPYVLHDFFLFYVVRYAYPPRKVFWLACGVFQGRYTEHTILKWLKVFYQRFFAQQFKRSAMPDGPKIGSVALSPRGDWRMPSDASSQLWLSELEALETSATDMP